MWRCHLSGAIPTGVARSSYDAELYGILSAICSAPIGSPLHIYCDSQSALDSIEAYRSELSCHRRLRMGGRPILALIAKAIRRKEEAMGEAGLDGDAVVLEWIRAHSAASSLPHWANRCADFAANAARVAPRRAAPASPQPTPASLRLEAGESFIAFFEGSGDRQHIIVGDIRKAAMVALRHRAAWKWIESPSQGSVAALGSASSDLWQWCVRRQPGWTRFVIRGLTDTLQYHRLDVAETCACSGRPDDLRHWMECRLFHRVALRDRLATAIAAIADGVGSQRLRVCVAGWRDRARRRRGRYCPLHDIVAVLRLTTHVDEIPLAMFGGFRSLVASASLSASGVGDEEARGDIIHRLRSTLVGGWKSQWRPPPPWPSQPRPPPRSRPP